MATATASPTLQQQQQQQQQQPQSKPQPAVDAVRQLLYRRLKVVLPSGRIIEGDLTCLDKQGNLILSNACEHILAAAAAGGGSSSGGTGSSSGGSSNSNKPPSTTQLGMVLVPKAQQQEVSLRVTLSEKAAMLSLVGAS